MSVDYGDDNIGREEGVEAVVYEFECDGRCDKAEVGRERKGAMDLCRWYVGREL